MNAISYRTMAAAVAMMCVLLTMNRDGSAIPMVVPYVGELSLPGGNPALPGEYEMKVTISTLDDIEVWSCHYECVAVLDGGVFELEFGQDVDDCPVGDDCGYLDLAVFDPSGMSLAFQIKKADDTGELQALNESDQRIQSVPYAYLAAHAADADALGGKGADSYLTEGDVQVALAEPGTPAAGQLWYDQSIDQLMVYVNGQWVPALPGGGGGGTCTNCEIKPDNLNEISNWALTNEFSDVCEEMAAASIPFPNTANGASNTAMVAIPLAEAMAGPDCKSYLTRLMVCIDMTFDVDSAITVTLHSPFGTSAVIHSAFQPAESQIDPCFDSTNPGVLDALSLVGQNPTGDWTLEVTSISSGITLGMINDYFLCYDVVRSDHVVVNGRLDVKGNLIAYQNVGIGTKTPQTKLHVKGPELGSPVIIESTAPALGFLDNEVGDNGKHNNWQLWADGNFNLGTKNQGFAAVNSDALVSVAVNGNVGIGTTNPQYKLDVVGSYINIQGSNGFGGVRYTESTGGSEIWQAGANVNGWHIFSETDDWYRLTVSNDGQVGIGTQNPKGMLEIHSNSVPATHELILNRNDGFTVGAVTHMFLKRGGANVAGVGIRDTTKFEISVPEGDPKMTIDNKGNVGIGTTTPDAALVIGSKGKIGVDGVDDLVVSDNIEAHGSITTLGGSNFFAGKVGVGKEITGPLKDYVHVEGGTMTLANGPTGQEAPACNAASRGRLWVCSSGAGVGGGCPNYGCPSHTGIYHDHFYVCLRQDINDNHAWKCIH